MKGNQEPMLYTTNAAVASLNHVPGFDPLKFLRRTASRKTGEDVMRLDLRYKKLWFRLACPTGRLKLNALRITEKMAIFEAKVYRDREDAEPLSSYIWLSSVGKPHGVTSGSPLHFVGEPFAKTVYVTEGLLKADIAHCLTGRSFVAVAGVNSLNGLESALRCMAQNGTKLVVEAYDMDKLENEYVAEAAEKVQQIAHTAGLQSTSLVWNTAYKGIDDWQLALRQEEAKEKAA